MRAVATALVLIAGAAVVLWYGNTLNSWVVGGLIGGLAALLLSIPISLSLFSFLSRRHDERLRAEAEAEWAEEAFEEYEYPQMLPRYGRQVVPGSVVYEEDEEYVLQYDDSAYDGQYYQEPREGLYPSPQYLQSARQHRQVERLPELPPQRPAQEPRGARPKSAPLQRSFGAKNVASHRETPRRLNHPGIPGSEQATSRDQLSQHRTAALRAARREAAQQDYSDEIDEWSESQLSRRQFAAADSSYEDNGAQRRARQENRSARRAPSQSTKRTGGRRIVDAASSQQATRRSLPPAGASSAGQPLQRGELQTDYLNQTSPHTEPIYQRKQNPSAQNRDVTTGYITRPLIRRAPYTYEDDPIRQELAEQIDEPVVRRSSRSLSRAPHRQKEE